MLRSEDRWVRARTVAGRMFYAAINSGGHGLRDQRIGLAESDDLTT